MSNPILKVLPPADQTLSAVTAKLEQDNIIALNVNREKFDIASRLICKPFDLAHADKNVLMVLATQAQHCMSKFVSQNAQTNLNLVEALYKEIKDSIPVKAGRIRAISLSQLETLLETGALPSGADFCPAGNQARIGHGGDYIFLQAKSDASIKFINGCAGSSELNTHPIKLKDFLLYAPLLKMASSATKTRMVA